MQPIIQFRRGEVLTSKGFKLKGSTATVSVDANLLGSDWNQSSRTCAYTATLTGGFWGTAKCKVNAITGVAASASATNLKTTDTFYLSFLKSGGEGYCIDGWGTITNFNGHI